MAQRTLNKLAVLNLRSLVREAKKTGRSQAKADGGGLTFTISASGYPAWVLRYRFQGGAARVHHRRSRDLGR